MPDSVCALVCRHYQGEAACACRCSEIPQIRSDAFPARCGRPPIAWEELEAFRELGGQPVVLGPEVLRTATAAAVALGALGVLTARWDGTQNMTYKKR